MCISHILHLYKMYLLIVVLIVIFASLNPDYGLSLINEMRFWVLVIFCQFSSFCSLSVSVFVSLLFPSLLSLLSFSSIPCLLPLLYSGDLCHTESLRDISEAVSTQLHWIQEALLVLEVVIVFLQKGIKIRRQATEVCELHKTQEKVQGKNNDRKLTILYVMFFLRNMFFW